MSVPAMVAGQLISAGVGAYSAHEAAQAQQEAARRQADAARRNSLMSMQANEPMRSTGYQALGDINSFFGYSTPAYQTANQLATALTPITSKQIKQAIKGGAGFDQLAQMGVLGSGNKSIKRLIKAGLSMEQIQQLRTGMQPQAAPQSTQATQAAPGGGQNWDALTNSPDYQFALQQGTKNAGNSFAARGGAASGNALRALSEFNQGLASGEIDKFLSRRGSLVSGGQNAINNVTGSANTYTNNLMDTQQQTGDARASGILGQAGAVIGGLGGLGTIWGRQTQQTPAPTQNSMYGPYSGGYQFPQQQQPKAWNYIDSLKWSS